MKLEAAALAAHPIANLNLRWTRAISAPFAVSRLLVSSDVWLGSLRGLVIGAAAY